MSWGLNIAIGLGTAVAFRALSNAAYQATLPDVDPNTPTIGPVFAAAAVPAISAGIAAWKKYPKVSAALFGVAAGGAISTAEYVSFAKSAQVPVVMPKDTYYWVLAHKDASLETLGKDTYTLAELPAKDAQIVNKYGNDPDIIQISRKNPDGSATTLTTKPAFQSGAAMRLGQGVGIPQSRGATRLV